jgi:hypothetical protein
MRRKKKTLCRQKNTAIFCLTDDLTYTNICSIDNNMSSIRNTNGCVNVPFIDVNLDGMTRSNDSSQKQHVIEMRHGNTLQVQILAALSQSYFIVSWKLSMFQQK